MRDEDCTKGRNEVRNSGLGSHFYPLVSLENDGS